MAAHPLDNPIWQSLAHRHRDLALAHGEVLRYPAQIAPFLGVPGPDTPLLPAIESLVAPGESVYLLGAVPPSPPGWALRNLGDLAQMVCEAPLAEVPGPDFIELGEAQRADVLALTALVYPHYFRAQTIRLGRYFGIYEDGALAAIIGERMGPPGWREISAVCTHPDYLGRGYARRLMAWLANDLLASGLIPFLHVSQQNTRALELYRNNGFRTRIEIPFWSLARVT
jgi:ribosomal protein S18 acetylase RimI-like enzyme